MAIFQFLFLQSPMLGWLPRIFFGLLLLAAVFYYVERDHAPLRGSLRINATRLFRSGLGFYALYPVILTIGQYYVWSSNAFSRLLLHAPLDGRVPIPEFLKDSALLQSRFGYFLFYSYGRFWINSILAIGVSLLFYLFLRLLRKRRGRFFEEGEPELGFVSSLIAGWPNFVLFVPFVFFFVVIVSLIRLVAFRARYTTLGYPFLAAALVAFLFGSTLISFFHLSVLSI